jgi:hypothetical protein
MLTEVTAMNATSLRTLIVQDYDPETRLVTFSSIDSNDPPSHQAETEDCSVESFIGLAGQQYYVTFCASNSVLILMSMLLKAEIPQYATLYSPRLDYIRATLSPESIGGLRAVNDLDIISLIGLSAILNDDLDTAVDCLRQLPLYKYLTFLEPRDEKYLAAVVFDLFDPRLHVNARKPDSSSAFRSAIGAASPFKSGQVEMRHHSVNAWLPADQQVYDMSAPGSFLIRSLKSEIDAGVESRPAMLRPHQKFAAFLRYCWLESIRPAWCAETLMLPELMFDSEPETASAFRTHLEISD